MSKVFWYTILYKNYLKFYIVIHAFALASRKRAAPVPREVSMEI